MFSDCKGVAEVAGGGGAALDPLIGPSALTLVPYVSSPREAVSRIRLLTFCCLSLPSGVFLCSSRFLSTQQN